MMLISVSNISSFTFYESILSSLKISFGMSEGRRKSLESGTKIIPGWRVIGSKETFKRSKKGREEEGGHRAE